MEPETALVGTYCAVELNAITLVDTRLAAVVHPGNAEHYYSFGLDESFKQASLFVFGMSFDDGRERGEYLGSRLMKFWFVGVAFFEVFKYLLYIRHTVSPCGKRVA